MTLEEEKLQLKEAKRLADLKTDREKSKMKLRTLTSAHLKAQEQELVATTADKLGILPPSQLTDFELPHADRKRKRKDEILHEVFVKENIVVDGIAKYFREQMLLAMKDEAGSNLTNKENDFMLDSSYGDNTLEELIAAVMLMARLQ
ncbi:hypothetical protein Tco_1050907 [Tanacetum coccineum]